MGFLPFENFWIITSLKPDEVQARLEKEIAPRKEFTFRSLLWSDPNFYFKGYLAGGRFEIERIIGYRNSFLPQISGTTEAYLNGSRVHVKMRMTIFVMIFMCFWLGILGVAGAGVALSDVHNGNFKPSMLLPIGMLVFGYILPMGGFKFESRKAKAKLIEILEGGISKSGV